MYKKIIILFLFCLVLGCGSNVEKDLSSTVEGRVYNALAISNQNFYESETQDPNPSAPEFNCPYCQDTGKLGDFGGPCPHCDLGKQRDVQRQTPLPINKISISTEETDIVPYKVFQDKYLTNGKWDIPDGEYYVLISSKTGCPPCTKIKNALKNIIFSVRKELYVYEGPDISTSCDIWNINSVPKLFKYTVVNKFVVKTEISLSPVFNNNGTTNNSKLLELIND